MDRRKLREFTDELYEQTTLHEFIDNAWDDVMELQHLASILSDELEDAFDVTRRRGERDEHGMVRLTFQQDHLDTLTFLAGRVWVNLTDLERRLLARANALTIEEDEDRLKKAGKVVA
jgi:hypothetical protein